MTYSGGHWHHVWRGESTTSIVEEFVGVEPTECLCLKREMKRGQVGKGG